MRKNLFSKGDVWRDISIWDVLFSEIMFVSWKVIGVLFFTKSLNHLVSKYLFCQFSIVII